MSCFHISGYFKQFWNTLHASKLYLFSKGKDRWLNLVNPTWALPHHILHKVQVAQHCWLLSESFKLIAKCCDRTRPSLFDLQHRQRLVGILTCSITPWTTTATFIKQVKKATNLCLYCPTKCQMMMFTPVMWISWFLLTIEKVCCLSIYHMLCVYKHPDSCHDYTLPAGFIWY